MNYDHVDLFSHGLPNKMAKYLFGSDEEDGSYVFGVNKDYVKKYNNFKEKQELSQLKEKHGDYNTRYEEDDDDSTSESEDENAEALTAGIERDFLKTLSMLQSKDPRIYDKDETFFNDESNENISRKKATALKPMHLKDYERQQLLTRGSEAFISDDESDEDGNIQDHLKGKGMSYVEEQKALKDSFKNVLANSDDENNEDDDGYGFLKKRVKTAGERQKEEDDYVNWLKGEGKHLTADEKKDLDALKSYWTDPKLDNSERFLRDYILNKGYKDKDDDAIPTYNEVVGGWDDNEKNGEDSEVEKEEQFERKYNFRYEEPDSEFIKSYPRTIASSVRTKDESRKQKRKERDERKEKEKEKKKEEIKQLKKLKRKEIMQKLDRLKEITGNEKIGFLEDDLEGNFDPAKYDSLMKDVFNNDYYNVDDTEKPQFSDDEELVAENWDEWQGQDEEAQQDAQHGTQQYCEEEDFNMDCDYIAGTKTNKKESLKDRKKGRRKKSSKFADAVENKKPTYNPDEKTFEEYFDEYYKLDYEDIIGDMPVRFNYRQVMPNDFGLSTEEVLICPDKELNQWCSVKKAMKYYTNDEERRYRTKFKRKAKDQQKKLDLLPSLKQKINEEQSNVDEETEKVLSTSQDRLQDKEPSTEATTSGWKKRLPQSKFKSKFNSRDKDFDQQRREKLEKMFKGAKRHKLSRLSSNRLAAYGLNTTSMKKRKNK